MQLSNNSLLPTCHTEVLLRISCNYTSSADQVSGCKWNYQTVESKLSEAQQFLITHMLRCTVIWHILYRHLWSLLITSGALWSSLDLIIRCWSSVWWLSNRITAYHLQLVIIRSYLISQTFHISTAPQDKLDPVWLSCPDKSGRARIFSAHLERYWVVCQTAKECSVTKLPV